MDEHKVVLRGCPFCGSRKVKIHNGTFSYFVTCERCKVASRLFGTKELAADWWNHRKVV